MVLPFVLSVLTVAIKSLVYLFSVGRVKPFKRTSKYFLISASVAVLISF